MPDDDKREMLLLLFMGKQTGELNREYK